MLSPGDVLDGKYRIERPLAEGGVGLVVLATQLQLERPVAIKYLRHEALAHADLVEQFEREARMCAKLRSEHVVRVHDVGVDPHIGPYMVMEYLEGDDLEGQLHAGPLPLEVAIDYVLQACEALGEVHEHAIVHRDLKPANLFLANRPRNVPIVKVIDFGISKVVPKRSATGWLAAAEETAGTPGYMAPEQLTGAPVDARADVWALGVGLFELLTGGMPFGGATVNEVCDAVVGAPPRRLAEARPDLPPAVDAVIATCLEKDPARRFPNVTAVAEALAPFAPVRVLETTSPSLRIARATDPRTTRPTVVVARKPAPNLGRPIALGLFTAALVAGIGLIALAAWNRSREIPPLPPPTVAAPADPAPTSSAPVAVNTPPAEPAPVASEDPPTAASAKPVTRATGKPRGPAPKPSGRSGLFGDGRQ